MDEASKRNFVSRKEDAKKETPKKATEEESAVPRFMNTRKGHDKPTFTELEKQRESSGKGELTSDPYKDRSREFMVSAINKCRWLKIRNIMIIKKRDIQKREEIIGIMTNQRRVIGLEGRLKRKMKCRKRRT